MIAKSANASALAPGSHAGHRDLWLAPGGLADQAAQARGGTRHAVLDSTAAALPIGRLAEVDEIASVIAFLCSQAAANVAGAAWSVDGGAVPVII